MEVILLRLKNIFLLIEDISDRAFWKGHQSLRNASVCPDNIKMQLGFKSDLLNQEDPVPSQSLQQEH